MGLERSDIIDYDDMENFWKINSKEFKIPVAFQRIFKVDSGKSKSSRLMWTVAMWCDYESTFYDVPVRDKIQLIYGDYLKDLGFYEKNIEMLEDAFRAYDLLQIDAPRRDISDWKKGLALRLDTIAIIESSLTKGYETLKELDADGEIVEVKKFLSTKDKLDLIKYIDDIRSKTTKQHADLKKLRSDYEKSASNSSIRGDRKASYLERRADGVEEE